MKNKKQWLTAFIIFILICGAALSGIIYFQKSTHEISSDELRDSEHLDKMLPKDAAKKDLKILMDTINNIHPAFINNANPLTRAAKEQYKLEISRLKENNSVLEIWQAAARITAAIGDSHTRTGYKSDDAAIYDISEEEKNNLVTINQLPINDLYKTFISQTPFEQEAGKKESFLQCLSLDKYLQFMGVDTKNGVEIATEDGQKRTLSVKPDSHSAKKLKPVEYMIDSKRNLGVFTLNSCVMDDNYKKTLDAFFREVSKNKIDNIAVDLRENPGGNSFVINEFIRYLPINEYHIYGDTTERKGDSLTTATRSLLQNNKSKPQFKGQVFALTSTYTFSATMDFALTISDNKIGKVIGEIPANMPSSYGDIKTYQLPATGLAFQVSTKYFERFDKSKAKEPLIPDYEVPSNDAMTKLYEVINTTNEQK